MTAEAVVNREREHAKQQANGRGDGKSSAFSGTSDGVDGGIVDRFEWSLVEVTLLVRVRIEEEALGAAFHLDGIQNLNGFLSTRPVFFRNEPTFESSLLGSGLVCTATRVFAAAGFFGGGTTAAGLVVGDFGSSADGCTSGVGYPTGKGLDVLAALGGAGV